MSNDKPAPDQGIDYFNRGHWLTGIQNRISFAARRRMFDRWLASAGVLQGRSVLDVGATPDRERLDSNCMIPWLHASGARVALYSPEEIGALQADFPYATILPSRGFGAPLPEPETRYDWVISSAVLEHAGNAEGQVAFIRDCARVANGLFMTTPNRFHWLEFHTKLPLIHWLSRPLHRRLLRRFGHTTWAEESHLRLVGAGELRALAARALGGEFSIEIGAVWTLGMPSNLLLIAVRRV